jgi:hypothetical protein
MSMQSDSGQRTAFVGVSEGGTPDDPASLNAALVDAAEKAVKAGAVSKDNGPVWYEISRLQVEIANQHIRTFKATVTPSG